MICFYGGGAKVTKHRGRIQWFYVMGDCSIGNGWQHEEDPLQCNPFLPPSHVSSHSRPFSCRTFLSCFVLSKKMLVRFTYCWSENGRSACSNRDKCPWVWVCCAWAAVSRSWHRTIAYDKQDPFSCLFPSENPPFLRNTSAKTNPHSSIQCQGRITHHSRAAQVRSTAALGWPALPYSWPARLLTELLDAIRDSRRSDSSGTPVGIRRKLRSWPAVPPATVTVTMTMTYEHCKGQWLVKRPWDSQNQTDQESNQNLLNKTKRIFFVSMWKTKQSNNQSFELAVGNPQEKPGSLRILLESIKKNDSLRASSHILKSNETRNKKTKVSSNLFCNIFFLFLSKQGSLWYYWCPPPPVAFWTLGEIKNSVHRNVKREDWAGRKREKVGQLCPNTETGPVQGWAMVNCIHLINQSMIASSRKAIVLPKTTPNWILPMADILHWITQDRGLD